MGAITKSQWDEWQAWFNIRGPFGPARDDFYWPQLLLKNSAPGTKYEDVAPPWLRLNDPARPQTAAFLRNWVGGREDEEEIAEGEDTRGVPRWVKLS